jgi:hypothetical protein
MTVDRATKQVPLPMESAGDVARCEDLDPPFTITLSGEYATLVSNHRKDLAAIEGGEVTMEKAALDLIDTGYGINSWARDYLAQRAPALTAITAPPVSPEPTKPQKRSGAEVVADVASKIVAHLAATGASFWTGGVPEARAQIGIPEDINGKTISSAFTRIEENRVAGFSATRASVSHRKRGTYALWTVTVAQTKRATR